MGLGDEWADGGNAPRIFGLEPSRIFYTKYWYIKQMHKRHKPMLSNYQRCTMLFE